MPREVLALQIQNVAVGEKHIHHIHRLWTDCDAIAHVDQHEFAAKV